MSEELQNLAPESQATKANWGRRLIIGGVVAATVIGAGAAAYAQGGFGHGRFGGKFMRGFMEYRVEQVLTDVGASAEQKDKIKTLFKTTMDEIRPERGARKEMRQEIIKILEAPTIDRNALEALRAKHIATIDAKSKTVAKAVADAAEVLTQDQRKKLIEEMNDFGPDHDRP